MHRNRQRSRQKSMSKDEQMDVEIKRIIQLSMRETLVITQNYIVTKRQ